MRLIKSPRVTWPVVIVTVSSLFLGACGDGDKEAGGNSSAPATSGAASSTSSSPSAAVSSTAAASSAAPAASTSSDAPAPAGKKVELTFQHLSSEDHVLAAEALMKAFMAKNPDITIKGETRPSGGDGDNLVKTRLATGDMTDVFRYNSGSLFQALNPKENLAPLTGEPGVANIDDSFVTAVKAGEDVYGVPTGTSFGGGLLYSRKIYEKLGLKVPTTWAEFMANNAKIKAAGIDPIIQTYGDPWTSQLFILGDFHNVKAVSPDFAEQYTNNKAKYATDPAAIKGFQRLEEVSKAGYVNKDFASLKFEEGLNKLAKGEGAHFPMLSQTSTTLYRNNPDATNDIGFFAQPGDDAATNGLTLWLPDAVYISKSTKGDKLEAAKKFLAFIASVEGCDAQTAAVKPTGPYLIKGCTLGEGVTPVVQDLASYLSRGAVTPALEFLSPLKGPALEQITVEVGSGIKSAADGAKLYDKDVEKQAQQLDLPGWK